MAPALPEIPDQGIFSHDFFFLQVHCNGFTNDPPMVIMNIMIFIIGISHNVF